MDKQDLRDAWGMVWPFVPPAIGAYFGMRWSIEQSPKQRIATWICSAVIALYLGEAVGEYFTLGTKSTSGATIIIAMLLSDIMAIVTAAARQWTADPVGAFKRWRDAWLGRGGAS